MNIVVNGASRGIGRATALRLASDTLNSVLATGRSAEKLRELSESHNNISILPLDLSETASISGKFLDAVSNRFKTIDILINMAGLMIPHDFMEITEKDVRLILETNLLGPAAVIRILKPFMHEGSHIVNISSMGGYMGSVKYRGLAWYSASKAAIACLTECLAEEFRSEGIKVNCLALGSVRTEMLEAAFPGYRAPVSAEEMGDFIADFALNGHKVFNGKILPVAITNP